MLISNEHEILTAHKKLTWQIKSFALVLYLSCLQKLNANNFEAEQDKFHARFT